MVSATLHRRHSSACRRSRPDWVWPSSWSRTSRPASVCPRSKSSAPVTASRAARAGRTAHVYVPTGTSPARLAGLRREGASIVETGVGYDEAVRLMADDAAQAGWTIVSDTGWDGYETIPRWIMAGYTWILDEAASAWGPSPPDVVVVQAGVGSFAGAVAGWLDLTYGPERPRLVVVEAHGSACVAASLAAGRRVTLEEVAPTTMAGLCCGEVSQTAWPALAGCVDACVTVSDADAADAVRRLGQATGGDPIVAAGPSGAAGVAGLVVLVADPTLASTRAALGLTRTARVLVFNTEGPIDR
ncbi:MAG TPA: pyridoxal-phosphate dependent enzyme [Vicinamibacterales bacterium]|nr:pyridoxal-phosphate dependent enzyme [Vicinamibacterales bacterium]